MNEGGLGRRVDLRGCAAIGCWHVAALGDHRIHRRDPAVDGPGIRARLGVVPQSDIVLLDPVFGTAAISNIGGMMIYESLFSWDSRLQPKPEMVGQCFDGLEER